MFRLKFRKFKPIKISKTCRVKLARLVFDNSIKSENKIEQGYFLNRNFIGLARSRKRRSRN